MDARALGLSFLAWALYPLWLAAGAADYLCHRLVHGFLNVIPLIAVGLLAAMNWPLSSHAAAGPWFESAPTSLLVSFCVLAGAPILEELVRTLRARRRATQGAMQHGAASHASSTEYAP